MTSIPFAAASDVAYLVDLPGLVHRHFHGRPPTKDRDGARVEAVRGTVADLRRIVHEQRPAYLGVAVESPRAAGPETWRHEFFEAYKSERRAKPRPPELIEQLARVRAIVEAMAIPILEAAGFEADDCLAAGVARGIAAGLQVVVVASDKDLQQLASERCILWDLRPSAAFRVVGPHEVRARWEVGPEQLGDLLALAGDSTDGIPGVPGIGATKAAALLRAHGRLAKLLRNAAGVKGKLGEALRAHRADAVLSRRLVTLRHDAPIWWSPQAGTAQLWPSVLNFD